MAQEYKNSYIHLFWKSSVTKMDTVPVVTANVQKAKAN